MSTLSYVVLAVRSKAAASLFVNLRLNTLDRTWLSHLDCCLFGGSIVVPCLLWDFAWVSLWIQRRSGSHGSFLRHCFGFSSQGVADYAQHPIFFKLSIQCLPLDSWRPSMARHKIPSCSQKAVLLIQDLICNRSVFAALACIKVVLAAVLVPNYSSPLSTNLCICTQFVSTAHRCIQTGTFILEYTLALFMLLSL